MFFGGWGGGWGEVSEYVCVGGGGGKLRKSHVKRANAMIIIACVCSANLGCVVNKQTYWKGKA